MIFSCPRGGTRLLRSASSRRHCGQMATHAHGINVDGNPSYPKVIGELKRAGELGRRCRCRPVRYLNNIVEQDRRAIKRRVESQSGISLLRFGRANDSGFRDGEHDPQGTSEVVGERRHPWADRVCCTSLRSDRRCLMARANHFSRSEFQVCNTSIYRKRRRQQCLPMGSGSGASAAILR